MKITKRYSGTYQDNIIHALQDARDYLGTDKFNMVIDFFANKPIREVVRASYMLLGMAGIEGLPRKAMVIYAKADQNHWINKVSW